MSDLSPPDLVFDALGEPARRRILELLRHGPVAVGALAEQLPIGRPAVSKHLRVLSGAQLIQHRRSGTRNLYSLAPQGLVEAQQWLIRNWDETLAAFGAYVAEHGDEHGAAVAPASSVVAPASSAPAPAPSAPASEAPSLQSRPTSHLHQPAQGWSRRNQ
jgi:DNA-binding transcriptional ArsR family regulator